MMRFNFTLTPEKPMTVEALSVVVPLKAAHAALYHFWPGRWGSGYNSGGLPPAGLDLPFKPFVWLGDEAKVTFEDAWVALLTTTLTLQGTSSPLPSAAVPDLRRTIRAIAADSKNVGHAQVPGGGTLWKATGEAFPEVWQARQKARMPATF